jgi:signal transduction histidine kinase/predicted ATPase
MGAGRDPSAVIVRESVRTRITRLPWAGRTVILKEPLGPDAEARLQHERAILERLRGVEGITQLADEPRYAGSITLADAGAPVAELSKPVPADDLAGIALQVTQAVARLHRHEVVHRDLSPTNIVVSASGNPTLVDFRLAASFAQIRPEFTHHSEIPGTLAYLAPEQTGRTGRAVDHRADLYALGAVVYELATGEPPFGNGDPLRLIHDHLARLPVPPAEVNPAVPEPLSQIIMHLLEKEPDNRYQSADGVVHDLEQLRGPRAGHGEMRVGARDFPVRLLPPSRLVGRDEQVAALKEAFAAALAGRCAGVLVSGEPGVGKTALVDELRPVVTASDGWFVAGKFDEYRRDQEFNAVQQAFTAFGRLLLAEPEDEVARIRVRMLRALGANAGLLATVVPEFATLLGPGDLGDPLTAGLRAQLVAVGALRAVASRRRPLVVFIDDLQWGGGVPLGFVDMVLSNEGSEGLLLVGAYRDGHVEPSHPLAAMLSRWSEAAVPHVRLSDLTGPDLAAMMGEILRVSPAAATELGEMLAPHSHGNPLETAELLNALRRDGMLVAASDGWRWEAAAVRAHLARAEAGRWPAARVASMPVECRRAVEAMACLGGRAKVSVLATAIGEPGSVPTLLEPALRDGILMMESGAEEAVRFRHDRIRENVLGGLEEGRRAELHLAMARRLAAVPELFAVAAEQYLPVAGAVTDAAERRAVAGLLWRSADEVTQIGEYPLVHALLSAALTLADPADTDALIKLRTVHHAALFSLGRLEEADEDYHALEALAATVLDHPSATALQVRSLTNRNRFTEAVQLATRSLRACGIDVPDAGRMPATIGRQFARLEQWLDRTDPGDDMARPDITDPGLLAAGTLLHAMVSPTFRIGDEVMFAWVGLDALRIWTEHGPGPTLVGAASNAALQAIAQRGEYGTAYRVARRILALAESRDWEPHTSLARLIVSLLDSWFEPVENSIQESQRAREGLLAGGDLANAGYTYHQAIVGLLDSAPTLDACLAQVSAARAFARRTGTEQAAQWLASYQWLADVLRHSGSAAAAEAIPADHFAGHTLLIHVRMCRAIAAAIFGDPAGTARHSAAALRLLPAVTGLSLSALAHPLHGLGLAWQARSADGDEREALLAELNGVLRWLGARAADGPDNFLHLLRLVEAEQAWTTGDFRAAAIAFDSARWAAGRQRRPWHRALITERAGRFYLAHGLEHTGYELLAQAREQYLAWGAAAKAEQMDWAYPGLTPSADGSVGGAVVSDGAAVGGAGAGEADVPASGVAEGGQAADVPRRGGVTAGTIDLLGILSASQALSSETSVDRLHARVVEVLSAMTGATGVLLVLWDEDRQDWALPGPAGGEAAAPLSVLRYLRRTQEPLAVGDAASDDRFARDPYFAGLACCSLLAVPVLGRGALRAVLLVENRLIRGAFTTGRLEAVGLIAGQLAVSLDNAQLYAEVAASRARIIAAADQARQRIERDLHDGAQQRLVSATLRLRDVQAALPPELGQLSAQLDGAVAGVNDALDEVREIARGIHPAILATGGLRPALRALARRSAVPVRLNMNAGPRLPEQVEVSAYYVVTEALTNAAKHARASAVHVGIEVTGEALRVVVADDGAGGAVVGGGTGLLGIKDRVEALGGRVHLDSPPGGGTRLTVHLPHTATTAI